MLRNAFKTSPNRVIHGLLKRTETILPLASDSVMVGDKLAFTTIHFVQNNTSLPCIDKYKYYKNKFVKNYSFILIRMVIYF